jgi:peptide deformylase
MSDHQILTGENNAKLRQKSIEISPREIPKIAKILRREIAEFNALGLAAPQVGICKRIFLAKIGDEFQIFANPEIVEKSCATATAEEGCLSLPGIWENVARPTEISVEFLDESGEEKFAKLQKMDARVFCHEFDHLNGVLFVDRI